MTNYTNNLTAEQLIAFIAKDYVELSYDKMRWQRDFHMKICREWLENQYKLSQLDPANRDWEYDGLGNRIFKGSGNLIYPQIRDNF